MQTQICMPVNMLDQIDSSMRYLGIYYSLYTGVPCTLVWIIVWKPWGLQLILQLDSNRIAYKTANNQNLRVEVHFMARYDSGQ